jgi:hypothetical protein
LCELDLESRLGRTSPQCKNVENQLGPVHDANPDLLLECRALSRRQILVKHDERGGLFFGEDPELIGLSPSDVRGRMWRGDSLNHRAGNLGSRRIDQACEFLQMLIDQPLRLIESRSANEDRPLDGRTEFNRRARGSVSLFVAVGAAGRVPGSPLIRLCTCLPDFLHPNRDPGLYALCTGLVECGSIQGVRQISLGCDRIGPVVIVTISSPVAEILHQVGWGVPNVQGNGLGGRVPRSAGRGNEGPVDAIRLRRDGQIKARFGQSQFAFG